MSISRWSRAASALPAMLALAACGRLDELQYTPATTPQQWCAERPCVEVGGTTLSEPLGTFLVFALAALWVGVGIFFMATRRGQRSRTWFGLALVLGGVGAAQAGISYQAFSYVLKCEGRQFCALTNGFEVGYSITQAFSVSAMVVAVAYACAAGGMRKGLIVYAAINAAVYLLVSVLGVALPSAALLSFEVLMLFALPGIILVMIMAGRSYRRTGDKMSRSILTAAILLVLVQVAYFAYYAAGITSALWDDGAGFYFSANDVLHVGMIAWLGYVAAALGGSLKDLEPNPQGGAKGQLVGGGGG